MKTFFLLILLSFSLLCRVRSQELLIEVSDVQTTFLIFDFAIASVDRGSQSLLSEQDPVGRNMLKLKAESSNLTSTNLHVLTSDGSLHDFKIRYAATPLKTTWDLRTLEKLVKTSSIPNSAVFESGYSEAEFLKLAESLQSKSPKIIKRSAGFEMNLILTGIYQSRELLFFQLWVENKTSIPYQVADLRLTVLDQNTKRKSSSNTELLAATFSELTDNTASLSREGSYFLVGVPTLTIANHKQLEIKLTEAHGDRELALRIKGKKLLKAEEISNFQLN